MSELNEFLILLQAKLDEAKSKRNIDAECDFVLYVGNKKLVKRKEFEQYISKSLEI